MTEAYFSRMTLKRHAAAVAPLISELVPDNAGKAMAVGHRLMWSVMPEAFQAEQRQGESPFLWRAAEPGKFYMLGPRPIDDCPFFRIETKPYQPNLASGDRVSFDLRVNATAHRTVGVRTDGRAQRRRVDVAMDHMRAQESQGMHPGTRAARREPAAKTAAEDWLKVRESRDGYRLEGLELLSYHIEFASPSRGKLRTRRRARPSGRSRRRRSRAFPSTGSDWFWPRQGVWLWADAASPRPVIRAVPGALRPCGTRGR